MIKKVALIFSLLVIAIIGGFITLQNSHQSTLNLYFTEFSMPFIVFMLLAVFLGGLLGVCLTYWVILKQRLVIRRLERNRNALSKEVDELRAQNFEREQEAVAALEAQKEA